MKGRERRAPAFWAAVRLVGFANLGVTSANWRSLIAEDGELWRAFVTDVRRYGAPLPRSIAQGDEAADTVSALQSPLEPEFFSVRVREIRRRAGTWGLSTPLRPWPGDRLSFADMREVHYRARRRLGSITADEDLTDVFHGLSAYEVPGRRLATEGASITKRNLFFLMVPPERPESLAEHVDMLFVMTAAGGLWPDFYRCHLCGRFNVHRKRPTHPGHHYCVGIDTCRAQARAQTRDEHRRAEYARLAALLEGGMPWLKACAKLRRSSRYCGALVRSFRP